MNYPLLAFIAYSLVFSSVMADPQTDSQEPGETRSLEQVLNERQPENEREDNIEPTPADQIVAPEPKKPDDLIQQLIDRNVIGDNLGNGLNGRLNGLQNGRSGGVGNGGDAVICADKIEMLDSYEARKLRFNINLNSTNAEQPTWRSMVNTAVQRLQRFDEVLASKLYDYSMEMVNDFEKFALYPNARGKHVYLGRDVILEIPDSNHVSEPEGCIIRQFISQKEPRFRRDFRYEFSLSIWELMDVQEQTMAILHEAWYRIMLENDATDSVAARYMNGLVASEFFETYTFVDYIQELEQTELKTYTILNQSHALKQDKIVVNLKEHTFRAEDELICAPQFKVKASIKKPFNLGAILRGQEYLSNVQFQDVCFKNSRVRKMVLPVDVVKKDRILRLPFAQIYFEEALSESPAIHFDEHGKLTHLSGIKASRLYQMFYICNGERSYDRSENCEEGPFNDRESSRENMTLIEFDENEKLSIFKI